MCVCIYLRSISAELPTVSTIFHDYQFVSFSIPSLEASISSNNDTCRYTTNQWTHIHTYTCRFSTVDMLTSLILSRNDDVKLTPAYISRLARKSKHLCCFSMGSVNLTPSGWRCFLLTQVFKIDLRTLWINCEVFLDTADCDLSTQLNAFIVYFYKPKSQSDFF